MSRYISGELPIKIEFEDDDFKLSSAHFSADGKFRCEHSLTLKRSQFKAVAFTDESNLVELICNVEGHKDGRPYGSYFLTEQRKM